MTFFISWIFLSILVGVYASSKKRNGIGWFFLSLIISPLITFIIVLVIDPPGSTIKKCPKCAEKIKIEALICRFCGYDFEEAKKKEAKEKEKEADAIFKKYGIGNESPSDQV